MRSSVSHASSGVVGLDDVLIGGFPRDHLYLIEGDPGTGKTTLALQFLLEGRERGESGLYVTLSESKNELLQIAASHGWNLDGVATHSAAPAPHRRRTHRVWQARAGSKRLAGIGRSAWRRH